MFKKIAFALTFLTAFTVAGFTIAPSAEAQRYWGRPYVNYYWGPPRVYDYGYYRPYRTYYRSYYDGPRVMVRPYYNAYYGPDYYYGGRVFR